MASGVNETSSAFCEYKVGLELFHPETRSAADHGGAESILTHRKSSRLMNSDGSYERVRCNSIGRRVGYVIIHGFQVCISTTETPVNADYLDELRAFVRDLGIAEQDHFVRPLARRGFSQSLFLCTSLPTCQQRLHIPQRTAPGSGLLLLEGGDGGRKAGRRFRRGA